MDISELPVPLRTRTLSYYVALFGIVAPFCSIIPFCWAYVIYVLISNHQVWASLCHRRPLFVVACCEVLFSIYQYRLWRLVSSPAPCGPGDPKEIQAAFKRLLQSGLAGLLVDDADEESCRPRSPEEDIIQLEFDDPRAIDFRNALRPWFGNASWSSIKRHQVRQWLYWSIYNADMPPYDSLTASQQADMAVALDLLQKRCGCVFEDGTDRNVETMRVTIDRANVILRPFAFYALVFLANSCLKKWLQYSKGVKLGHHDGLEYLLYTPKHWDAATGPRPLVFIHGLGVGLLMYKNTVNQLIRICSDRPVLVLLQPQVSQDIFHSRFLKPMPRHDTTKRLAHLLVELGWVHHNLDEDDDDVEEEKEVAQSLIGKRQKGVSMLSHSNGSYIHAWMLKGYQKMVGRSCFVDPVTFCSWEGDVCHNFFYRQPKTFMEVVMYYFVATEIGVVNLLARHFDWASNTLWFEDIPHACDPAKALFLLGGQDSIVRSERVKRYLTSHGVKQGLCFDPEGTHGHALSPGTLGHLEILRWIGKDT